MKKQGSGVRGQGSEKTQNKPPITAQTVSDALAKLGGAGALVVADHLQAQTYKERSLVRTVLSYLLQAGGVKAVRQQGFVIYHLNDNKPRRGGVQAKLWEFACLRFATAKPFGVAEAARLAECDRDYTKRYCRWLWKSGYLAIVSRGKAGVVLYQVVGGKEHEAAPQWNRRAEKRKSVGQAPSPAALSAAGIIYRNPAITFFDEGINVLPTAPPEAGDTKTIMRAALEAAGVTASRARLDAALEDFGRALVEVTGSIGRAWEIIREMKGELMAMEDRSHDEPGEPTAGGH